MSTLHDQQQQQSMFKYPIQQGIAYHPSPSPSAASSYNTNNNIGSNGGGGINPMFHQLKNQIEYYFRPENLAKDSYLLSHLHATEHLGAVPIQVICHFPKVRQLYTLARFGQHVPTEMAPPADPVYLQIAIQGSSVVKVSEDGMWVSPYIVPEPQFQTQWAPPIPSVVATSADSSLSKETSAVTVATATTELTAPASPSSQTTGGSSSVGVPTHPLPQQQPAQSVPQMVTPKERDTIFLRDVPASATEETILKVFSTEEDGGVVPKSAKPEIGNSWYVTFESEEQAVAAMAASRDKTIDGAPIRGHLKSALSVAATYSAEQPQRPSMPPSLYLPPPATVVQKPNQRQISDGATPQQATPMMRPPAPQQTPYYMVAQQQSYGYGGYIPYGYVVSSSSGGGGGGGGGGGMQHQQHQRHQPPPRPQQHQQQYGTSNYPMQQRYSLGYVRPRPPQHNRYNNNQRPPAAESAPAPPSNVYVRPFQQMKNNSKNGHNQSNRSNNSFDNGQQQDDIQNRSGDTKNSKNTNKSKRNRSRNNRGGNASIQHSNSDGSDQLSSASTSVASRQPQKQQQPERNHKNNQTSRNEDNGDKHKKSQQQQQIQNSATNNGIMEKKSNKKSKNKKNNKKNPQQDIKIDLNQFPALGGVDNNKISNNQSQTANSTNLPQNNKPGGYAEALLKQKAIPPKKPSPSSPPPPPTAPTTKTLRKDITNALTDEELEKAMNKLAFAKAAGYVSSSDDEW